MNEDKIMLDKLSKQLIKPIRLGVFLVMLIMVALVVTQIFCRFVINISVPWTEEMARLCFVWIIFLGSAIVECEGGQVSTTIFIQRMRNTPRFILLTVIHAVEILFNLCLFVGCIQSWNTVKMMTFSTVPAWNYQLLYIPLILAAPVMIFYLVVQNIEFYHTMFPKKGGAG